MVNNRVVNEHAALTLQPVDLLLELLDRLLSELSAGLSLEEWFLCLINCTAGGERDKPVDVRTSFSLTVRVLIWRLYSSTRWLAFSSETSRDFKLLPTTFNSSSSSMILLKNKSEK